MASATKRNAAWFCLMVLLLVTGCHTAPPNQARRPGDLRLPTKLQVGDLAPDFTLKQVQGGTVRLASFRGRKPVVLVFGSYTCNLFRDQYAPVEEVYEDYRANAEFFMIYIKEAHPSDGWVLPENVRSGISFKDPKSFSQRSALAATACSALPIKLPCLIDGLNNGVNQAYSAWPDRIFVVDTDGTIAVLGGQGPFGFTPAIQQARQWLAGRFQVGPGNRPAVPDSRKAEVK